MRKRLMILALVLIAVLMTCTLAACSGGGGRCSDGHTWDEGTVKEAATCLESGTLINKCTVCGIKREVAIEALGHDLQTIPGTVVEPTCELDGYAGKKACVREGCEYVLDTGTVIPAIGHAYGDWTSNGDGTHKRVCANDSNHVESGNCSGGTADCGHKAVCDVCGGEYGDFASSHVFDKQVTTDAYKATDATCEAKATYYYSCQCGEKGTETFEYGDYSDHVFDREEAKAEYLVSVATCTSPAIYNKSCACGLEGTETFEYGDALPHTFDKQEATVAYKATDATCTKTATYYYSCDCGAHGTATFAYGDMLAHVYDKEVAEDKYLASAATCEKKATYYKSCYCGHFDAEVSATFESGELGDHVYDNKVVNETYKATDATCTEKATYYFSCDCGKAGTETFESGETLPHVFDKEVPEDKYLKFAANCASAAVYYKSCACGHFDTETSPTFYFGAPSGNHVFDRKVDTDDYKATDATCTAKATYYYSCECGEKGTTTFESGATLDHTMTHTPAKAATCVSTGNVEYWTCSTCSLSYDSATGGNVIEDVTTAIDSTNHVHTTSSKPAVAPDCENTGLTAEISCADCDKVLEEREEIPALGHDMGDWFVSHEPTCTVTGVNERTCKRDGCDYFETEAIPTIAHSVTTLHPEVPATCTKTGTKEYYECENCDKYVVNDGEFKTSWGDIVIKIDATNHVNTEKLDGKAANCTETGLTEGEKCKDCGATIKAQEEIPAKGHDCSGETPNFCVSCEKTLSVDEIIADTKALGNNESLNGTYQLTGVITSIPYAFSNGSLSINIMVEGETLSLEYYCYKLKGDNAELLEVGNTVTIKGSITNYYNANKGTNTIEFVDCTIVAATLNEYEVSLEVVGETNGQVVGMPSSAITRGESVTITVTANDGYKASVTATGTTVTAGADNTYSFVVMANTIVKVTFSEISSGEAETVTINTNIGDYAAAHSWENSKQYSKIEIDANVTATAVGGSNTGKYYTNGNNWRIYQNENPTISIAVVDGYKLVSIKISYTVDNTGVLTLNGSNIASADVVEVNASSIVFGVGNTNSDVSNGQVRITQIDVVYVAVDTNCTHENKTEIKAVEPTCTESGSTAGEKCVDCGAIIVAPETIEATGHDYKAIVIAPTCTEQGFTTHTCSVCGDEQKDTFVPATGHTYVDGKCSECGTDLKDSASEITASKTIAELIVSEGWTSSTTKQSFNLDKNVSVKINGGSNTGKAYEGDHIRIYATDTPAGTITISVPEGYELVSIKISTKTGTYAFLYVDGTTTDISNVSTTVSGNRVVLNSVKNGSDGKQVRVTAIEVIYREVKNCEHDYVAGNVVAPKCEEQGYTVYACSKCNATENRDYVPALGHKAETVAGKDATCTETGLTDGSKCSACGEVLVEQNAIPALGHTGGKATCTEKATCTVCGEAYGELAAHTEEILPAVDATCTKTGLKEGKKCSVCGEILVAQEEIALKDHTAEVVAGKPATCTETGLKDGSKCSVCGKVLVEQEVINALGHDFAAGEVVAPKCEEQGYTIYDCSRCDATENRDVVAALGHKYDQNNADAKYLATPATCTAKATYYKSCSCGQFDAEKSEKFEYGEIAVDAHDWDEGVYTEPTCTADGYTTYTCKNNAEHKNVVTKENSKLDHSWVETSRTEATCVETGAINFVCEHDNSHTKTETIGINANAHDLVKRDAKAPTCTEIGWDAYEECSRCDHTTYVEKSALGHDEVEHAAQAPTCEEIGWDAYVTCSRCNYTTYVEKEAAGHKYESVVTDPTCEADGYTTYTCSVCKHSYNADTTNKLGHAFGEWIETEAPTCTEKGESRRDCDRCDHFEIKEISAAGHKYEGVVTAPTCEADGYTTYTCSVCKHSYTADTTNKLGHEDKDSNNVCDRCEESLCEEHTSNKWESNETNHWHICTACGFRFGEVAHTAGEVVVENEKDATCTEAGSYDNVVYCTVCSAELSRETITVDATDHDYQAVVTAPTCTDKGYTTHTCSKCADSYVDTHVDALNHDLVTEYEVVVVEEVNTLHKVTKCVREGCEHIAEDVTVDTTKSVAVANEKDLRTVLENGFNATLTSDITLEAGSIEIAGKTVTVNLNEHNITVTGEKEGVCEAFYVQAGGKLTINGNGTILAKDKGAEHVISLSAVDGAVVTINGGDFVSEGSTAVYATRGAVVNIYGGTYSAVAYNGQMFTIDVNEAEAVLGVINIYGGTFHNFDPANHTNDGTYTNKVMDGYHSIKDGDNYVVSEHTEVVDAAVAPTCTATGLTEGKHCSVCNKVLVAQEVVKALDHTYDQNNADAKYLATPATCTEKATYYKSCTCGDFDAAKSEKFEYGGIAVDEHDWDEGVYTEPTCTADGYTTYSCKNNAEHKNVVTEENSKLDHTYDQNNADAKYLATPATCKEKATYYKSCTCGHFDKEKSETFEVDGYADHTGGTATCTEKATCTVCGEEYGVLAAHTPAESVEENRVGATCTKEGSYDLVVKCSVCGEELSRETKTIDKVAHSSVEIPAVAPTCTETGLTDGSKCSVCGEILVAQEVVAATGHALPEEWTVVTAPTCAEKGSAKRECTSCDYVETKDLDMIAHTPAESVEENRVGATCTKEGSYDSVIKCSVCGEEISREVKTINKEEHTIDATGHCVYCYATNISGKVTASKSVSDLITEYGWDGNTTKQSFNLDEVVSVKINGGTNTGKAYEGDHIRIYATDSPAGTITISVPEGYELVSIKISTQTGTYAFLYLGEGTTDICNVSTTVSGNEVVLNSVKNGSNGKQVRVTAFEVVYERPVLCEHANRQAGETVEATCKEKGYTSYTCPDCDEAFNWDFTSTIAHNVEFVSSKEATCTETGVHEHYVCTNENCGMKFVDEEATTEFDGDTIISTIDHKPGEAAKENVVKEDCLTAGSYDNVVRCTECNCVISSEHFDVDPLNHPDENPKDGTCDVCGESTCKTHTFKAYGSDEDGHWKICDICGQQYDQANHTEVVDAAVAPKCEATGLTEGKHCSVCDKVLVAQEVVEATGHTYTYDINATQHISTCACGDSVTENHSFGTDGFCTCGYFKTKTYTFSDYTAGTQYAVGEEHELDDNTIVTTTKAHFTSELRLYSSETYDAFAIIYSAIPVGSITLNAGNKVDTLNVYVSDDGIDWTLMEGVSITSTSYINYLCEFGGNTYRYIKLDVAGTQQVRVKYFTISTAVTCAHENCSIVAEEVAATCITAGKTAVTICDNCGEQFGGETIPATNEHTYGDDGVCTTEGCTATENAGGGSTEEPEPTEVTAKLSFASTDQRTAYDTSKQVWEQNGIVLTNNKGSSTSNVPDYAAPARFYKNSEIIIKVEGAITEIVFDCNDASYATALSNSIAGASAVSVSSDKVTVTLDGSSNTFTISLSGGQVRMDSVTVTYSA